VRARERQAEIIRILMGRKKETISQLAAELEVSVCTIYRDIDALSVDYPLHTQQGHGGGVTLMDWHHPHKNLFSQEQNRVLNELLSVANGHQADVLRGLINAYGTTNQGGWIIGKSYADSSKAL